MNLTPADYSTIWPLILLTVWACVLLLVDLFIPKERKGITALLSVLGLALTLNSRWHRSVRDMQPSTAWLSSMGSRSSSMPCSW